MFEAVAGDIVYSKAGRDKGKFFVVMAVDGDYVYISNGASRKTDKPKKKKIKHLKFEFGISEYIGNKLMRGDKVTNAELRIELEAYNNPPESGENSTN